MKISGAEITGHRIVFCLLERDGQEHQYLSIIPVGFLDYHDARWEANYVMVKIHLVVTDNNHNIVDEHMTVGSFMRLHDLLIGFQNGVSGSETFGTVDGCLELSGGEHSPGRRKA